ncbi:MAG: tyrosine recombinase [Candidatus Eisenbacteria bacterium]|nr:tyrosine recombinase [Candidatus Eisenbacteria bacterium]
MSRQGAAGTPMCKADVARGGVWHPGGGGQRTGLPPRMARALESYLFHLSLVQGASARTVSAYAADLATLGRSLAARGRRGPARVSSEDLRRHLIELHERGRQPATVARARSAIRSFFAFLQDEGVVAHDPAGELEAPSGWRRIPRALTPEEANALIETIEGRDPLALRDRALLECAYGTGARVSELLGLRPGAVRWEEGLVRLDGKGERSRLVPLGLPAREALRTYITDGRPLLEARRGAEPPEEIFLNARGGALGRMGFWKILRKRATQAGLRGRIHPHLLRHSYATHLLHGGASLRAVQELLGHARLGTTQIYTSVDDAYLHSMHQRYHPRG